MPKESLISILKEIKEICIKASNPGMVGGALQTKPDAFCLYCSTLRVFTDKQLCSITSFDAGNTKEILNFFFAKSKALETISTYSHAAQTQKESLRRLLNKAYSTAYSQFPELKTECPRPASRQLSPQ